ncbi:hypothetical protein OK016_08095 [Vibrio chagasii]|nr:hypothetical protein [Vibrio chagasii]
MYQVFTRDGVEKTSVREIEQMQLKETKKDLTEEFQILEGGLLNRVKAVLLSQWLL